MKKKTTVKKAKTSEFGKGCVYCLMLFAKHFENDMATRAKNIAWLIKQGEEKRKKIFADKPEPKFNYGREMRGLKYWFTDIVGIYGSEEKALSSVITTWANGATDHLYELKAPKNCNPKIKNLIELLKSKGLDMGHGAGLMGKELYKIKHIQELVDLTHEILFLIDKNILGVSPIEATWK